MNKYPSKILDYLIKDNIKGALKLLLHHLNNNPSELFFLYIKEVNSLSSKLDQLALNFNNGLIEKVNYILEKNQLASSIISILNNIDVLDDSNKINLKNEKLNIFISYSFKDVIFKSELEKYLSPLKHVLIDIWEDKVLLSDHLWYNEIFENINNSDVVIFLVSPDFINSEFCYSQEMYSAVNKSMNGSLLIIPILLRRCDFTNTPFGNIQFLPTNGIPINEFKNKEEAYSSISINIKKLLEGHLNESNEIRKKINSIEYSLKKKPKISDLDKIQSLINYYKRINNSTKVSEFTTITNKLKFEFNKINPITINSLHLEGVSIFNDIHWEAQPTINILLGRNGFGKSHLLRLLPCLLKNEKQILDIDYKLYSNSILKVEVNQKNDTKLTHYNDCKFIIDFGIVPILAIPSIRNLQPNKSISPSKDEFSGKLCEIGASHFINQQSFDSMIIDKLFVLGNQFIKSENDYFIHKKDLISSPIIILINTVVQELTNSNFEISEIKGYFGQSHIDINVITDGNDELIAIQKASQGTLSIVSIILLIYFYLKSLYPKVNEKDILKQKSIVFIDELDAHLHPIWQMKIIGILRRNFPSIQFFITSHSPLLVAGCKEREITVLRKSENNKFSLYQFENNFIGAKINEIYNRVFEIESLNDEFYNKYIVESTYKKYQNIVNTIEELENKININEKDQNELEDLHYLLQVMEKEKIQNENNKDEIILSLQSKIRGLEESISNLNKT